MVNRIARLLNSLRTGLFPAQRSRGRTVTVAPPPPSAFRRHPGPHRYHPSVVFVHTCHLAQRGRHVALLLPWPQTEFERWERSDQRLRQWWLKETWLTASGRAWGRADG